MYCLREAEEMKVILTHKANQLQLGGHQFAEEEETKEAEEDYFNMCQQLLAKLNEDGIILRTSVFELAQKEEIQNGQEKDKINNLLNAL